MRNWGGCKKIGVVGCTSSDIDLLCTTTGYTRPISQLLGTLAVIWILCTQPTGYASNDIDLGSWVQNHWEHRVYCLGYRGMPVPYTAFGYTSKKKNKQKKNNDVNLGYITIGKTELSVLTGCRRVVYAISVHTQPFGMLAVIYILCTQLLCTLNQYHC